MLSLTNFLCEIFQSTKASLAEKMKLRMQKALKRQRMYYDYFSVNISRCHHICMLSVCLAVCTR